VTPISITAFTKPTFSNRHGGGELTVVDTSISEGPTYEVVNKKSSDTPKAKEVFNLEECPAYGSHEKGVSS